jgi:hypothetical protein
MPSSVILCRVALVRTDVSEDRSASIIRVTRIVELNVNRNEQPTHAAKKYYVLIFLILVLILETNVVPSSPILVTLMSEGYPFLRNFGLTKATWHHIPEDHMRNSHRRDYGLCSKG